MLSFSLIDVSKLLSVELSDLSELYKQQLFSSNFGSDDPDPTKRRFSRRDMFQFGLASVMRDFGENLQYIRAAMLILDRCEEAFRQKFDGFELPDTLTPADGPDLSVILRRSDQLMFAELKPHDSESSIFGPVWVANPEPLSGSARLMNRSEFDQELPPPPGKLEFLIRDVSKTVGAIDKELKAPQRTKEQGS
jgi:hypothetical protein